MYDDIPARPGVAAGLIGAAEKSPLRSREHEGTLAMP